ncbi:hypothetical protein K458DRAFT_129215 [Lentithecium fluviatile CBS 122367]|uniref:Uncharacterized protein n=1 Tax=Lentithecium fluviatile CBS 122367 TaxID=1168545 RepID=A0A6G1JHA3_9PLEO|nr:hypothetical protein K458DRAFT_129215 [Lentithecium fluviatile CBS 122367]
MMGFLEDAFKTLDSIGHDVSKHAGHAVADSRAADSVGQEIGSRIDPSTLRVLEHFGEEAGKHVGATADDIWKALMGAGGEIGKHTGPVVDDVGRALGGFGQEVGKHIAGAVEDAKEADWESLPADIREWIEKHPEQTMGIVAGISAAPLAVAAVPAVLGAAGFTAEVVAAGSIAAGTQSGIGNVAVNSLFATLMSAGQGGAGLAAVQGVVGGVTGIAAVGANILGLMETANEGRNGRNNVDKDEEGLKEL